LSSLHHFSFDRIKIDRSFVNDLSEGSSAIAIVRSVAILAKSLGIVVTAEGVESRDQLKLLRAEECHEAQGYLFASPAVQSAFGDPGALQAMRGQGSLTTAGHEWGSPDERSDIRGTGGDAGTRMSLRSCGPRVQESIYDLDLSQR
jgi:predicted signal transduction protein with EAL and GGDEF domain